MGCGALCGSTSSVSETIKESEVRLKKLLKEIMPNSYLFPVKLFAHLLKDLQLNPLNYHLTIADKLTEKMILKETVKQKWKAILYGLYSDIQIYVKCLGYLHHVKVTKQDRNKGLTDSVPSIIEDPQKLTTSRPFSQIEKDLDRTFEFPSFQKESFGFVLKRISNHFPNMGYTQGINFIVGYLLIIGYSEEDAFWLFTHIALNQKYLLLGLFEDGFPLSYVYSCIFKNILKRENAQLFDHLYVKLGIDQSLWVFKWFITCYIYSFPVEMCQYVWDLVITVGGTGLITFAIGLIKNIQGYLFELQDACDMSFFLTELKNIDNFNKCVNLKEVLTVAYSLQIRQDDLKGLQNLKNPDGSDSFYAKYFLSSYKESFKEDKAENTTLKRIESLRTTNPTIFKRNISQKQSNKMLEQWYEIIQNQRTEFRNKSQQENSQKVSKEKNQSLIQGRQSMVKNENIKLDSQLNSCLQKVKTNPNEDRESVKQSRGSKKGKVKQIPMGIKEFFNSDDEDEEKKEKLDKIQMNEFFYLPKSINLKKQDTRKEIHSQKQRLPNEHLQNYFQYNSKFDTKTEKRISQHIVRAGKQIVTSMSRSNVSNRSSVSQKKNIQKENHSGRSCNCKRDSSLQRKSCYGQKKFQTVEQNQIKNPQQFNKIEKVEKKRKSRNWIVNLDTDVKKTEVPNEQKLGNQVEINDCQMFKKKRRPNQTGFLKITNLEEYSSKMGSCEKESMVFGEQNDSFLIANFSSQSQQGSRISQIESAK